MHTANGDQMGEDARNLRPRSVAATCHAALNTVKGILSPRVSAKIVTRGTEKRRTVMNAVMNAAVVRAAVRVLGCASQ